jgi:hypothetical protein
MFVRSILVGKYDNLTMLVHKHLFFVYDTMFISICGKLYLCQNIFNLSEQFVKC